MVAKFTLLNSLLLASTTLAARKEQPETLLPRAFEPWPSDLPVPVDSGNVSITGLTGVSDYWSGAVRVQSQSALRSISGSFEVPSVPSVKGTSGFVFLRLDGDFCGNAKAEIGIGFHTSKGSPNVGYFAWHWLAPNPPQMFKGFNVTLNDTITLGLNISDPYTVSFTITSAKQALTYIHRLNSTEPLCGLSGAWGISGPAPGNPYTLTQYGVVMFENASAATVDDDILSPYDAILINLKQDDNILSIASLFGKTLIVQRTGK